MLLFPWDVLQNWQICQIPIKQMRKLITESFHRHLIKLDFSYMKHFAEQNSQLQIQ